MLAWVRTARGESVRPVLDRSFALMRQTNLSTENRLRLYRLFMYTTTEIPPGLSADERRQLHGLVASQFPAADERLNRESALLLAYAGQTEGISEILAAVPPGNENQALQLHYLYALRTVKRGWTLDQKTAAAEILGRTSRWRGGAQFTNFLGQMFDQFAEVYTTDADKQVLYAKAPDFAPLTPAEIAAIQARGGGAGRGGRGGAAPLAPAGAGARGTPAPGPAPVAAGAPPAVAAPARGVGGGRGGAPVQTRTQGRTLNKGEIFDEVIYTPRTQTPNADMGRAVFEASCAACHRAGAIGSDHGVAGLNLTASAPKTARRELLESIMFPSRSIRPEHETTVVTKNDGTTESGLLVRESTQSLTLLRANGTTVDVPKPVRSQRKERTTIRTDAITDAMNQGQLANLLAFLRGAATP
jgi:putative heme-binding domain-containing protein